jgi:predicted Zn-dependent protease
VNRYYMNSEGTATRFGSTYYQVDVAGATQADDGMVIQRDHPYVTVNPAELPSWDQLKRDTETVLATLKDLRTAPLVDEEYQGPVLFSNDAASSVFSHLFAPGIAAFKPDPGTTARTKGEYASFFKAKVLPDFINVIDDPTQTEFQHHTLTGSYVVDDEGVKSQPVTVVEKGQLLNYLVGRQPIRDFLTSNGHGRAPVGGPPLPHIGVLRVTSTQSSSPKELEAKLIAMCKDQGKAYGYYVETTGPSLTPRLLYRVRVADGKRELVRGAVFGQLDERALRNDITVVGNDDYIDNTSSGIPQTVIAPSILFGELEVKRANPSQEKLPLYAPPAISQP